MKEFEDICREYEKDPTEVETDLMSTLKCPEVRIIGRDAIESNYFATLVTYLHTKRLITRDQPYNKRTIDGDIALNRGWVCYNTKAEKHKRIKQLIKWLIVTAATVLIGFFLERLGELVLKKVDQMKVSGSDRREAVAVPNVEDYEETQEANSDDQENENKE